MNKFGDLFNKLGDPTRQAYFKLPADDVDLREFLEAARKLFVGKTDKDAKKFLKMPIDTPDAAGALTKALVAEIDRINQEAAEPGAAHDHRLEMARLIESGLKQNPRTEAHLRALTVQILEEADRFVLAERSRSGGFRPEGSDQTKQRWARPLIVSIRKAKPDIPILTLAKELFEKARKKDRQYWPNAKAVRAWLYRNPGLWQQEKAER
jgi:hypothetical protein